MALETNHSNEKKDEANGILEYQVHPKMQNSEASIASSLSCTATVCPKWQPLEREYTAQTNVDPTERGSMVDFDHIHCSGLDDGYEINRYDSGECNPSYPDIQSCWYGQNYQIQSTEHEEFKHTHWMQCDIFSQYDFGPNSLSDYHSQTTGTHSILGWGPKGQEMFHPTQMFHKTNEAISFGEEGKEMCLQQASVSRYLPPS